MLKHFITAIIFVFVASLGPATAASAAPAKVTITAKNFTFAPSVVTLKVGQPTQLTFVGAEGVHGLTAPDIGLTQSVTITGTPTTVTVTPQKAGTFVAHCAIFCGIGHPKMQITFHVLR